MMSVHPPRVVLASTSVYRAELLRRLLDDFEQRSPDTDESLLAGESPAARAARLAEAKAAACAKGLDGVLVIGSDQVAELDGLILRKPGSVERAIAQLTASSAHRVNFHTAVCLLDTRDGTSRRHVDHTTVQFRSLSRAGIERYIERESPLDCAGSFKCEGLGISLFEAVHSSDPTALVGLPLIALAGMLRSAGVSVP
jgi:septum formation protein